METKNTSSSGLVLEEPEIQKLQMQAKIFRENSLNELNALKSTTQLLEQKSILYQQAFAQLFGDSLRTFDGFVSDEEIEQEGNWMHITVSMAKISGRLTCRIKFYLIQPLEQVQIMMKRIVLPIERTTFSEKHVVDCVDESDAAC
ncbi:hypothetical protein Tco_0595939 [Tanacetum coccineum]